DLQRSFAPVVADLRRSLSAVLEQTAVAIPLQERRYGVRVGPITDRSILRAACFVLTVQADVPTETLQRLFPSQVKIGAVEHIRDLVNVAIPGIAVRPMPGGRRSAAADAPVGVAEPPRPSPAPGVSSEGVETFAMGLSPLVAAAAPLLQLMVRLRNTVNQPDPGDLRERAVQAMRRFEQ